ncbi:hypothetical protein [endosymbiont GvMRE of Glomus versiforme]|uniref:hypothetical protein n=1 Tax=endosymbiont GvMRE of Glomus versiforme TaxID=2039283 RepID=UPI000ECC4D61|nr:hypothetical protein [endosymbiont GvMRE of Glomus versiforme]RHZ36375.1 hypothetical protein GvMRE_Ic1g147 [endosymbiont GvMRE of Glomus versiforme]
MWIQTIKYSGSDVHINNNAIEKSELLEKIRKFCIEHYLLLLILYALIWISALIFTTIGIIKYLNARKEIEKLNECENIKN